MEEKSVVPKGDYCPKEGRLLGKEKTAIHRNGLRLNR